MRPASASSFWLQENAAIYIIVFMLAENIAALQNKQ
jgi:hypothetical protein